MIRRIMVLVFLVFFAVGTVTAATASNPKPRHKNYFQALYNFFGTWDGICVSKWDRCCKTCGKKCCKMCSIDCGGTCCPDCGKDSI